MGALASMTRANGIALFPTLIVEALFPMTAERRWNWRSLWIALVPAGYLVYLALNVHFAGHAFGFLATHEKLFYTAPSWPWEGIHHVLGDMDRAPSQAEVVGVQELLFIVLGLICVAISWIKLRASYSTWMTLNWLGITSLTFVQSAPRYSLAMFPIFILFAMLGRNKFWNGLLNVWSLLFLALFASLFARGWWAF
jgi:hypothetical protein